MRGFARGPAARVAVLFSSLFLFALSSSAAVTVNVFTIKGPNWPGTSLRIHAESASVVRLTDCSGLSHLTSTLVPGAIAQVERFGEGLCGSKVTLPDGTTIRVARLQLLEGDVDAYTDAVFESPNGSGRINVVEMRSLPSPLEGSIEHSERYVFAGIESGVDALVGRSKSTYIALLTEDGRSARVRFELRDATNKPILDAAGNPIVETETVSGFAFHEITTATRVGTVVMTNAVTIAAPFIPPPRVWAIAFVSYRDGAPRAIVPRLLTNL